MLLSPLTNSGSIQTPTDENSDSQITSSETSSPFDTIPDELLQEILQKLPHHELNRPNIGPKRVCRRFYTASTAVFNKQSIQSPKTKRSNQSPSSPPPPPRVSRKRPRALSDLTNVPPKNLFKENKNV